MNENVYTTYLEVYHSVRVRYLPKSSFFEAEKMLAGSQLAALDHNNSVGREQVCHLRHYLLYVTPLGKQQLLRVLYYSFSSVQILRMRP